MINRAKTGAPEQGKKKSYATGSEKKIKGQTVRTLRGPTFKNWKLFTVFWNESWNGSHFERSNIQKLGTFYAFLEQKLKRFTLWKVQHAKNGNWLLFFETKVETVHILRGRPFKNRRFAIVLKTTAFKTRVPAAKWTWNFRSRGGKLNKSTDGLHFRRSYFKTTEDPIWEWGAPGGMCKYLRASVRVISNSNHLEGLITIYSHWSTFISIYSNRLACISISQYFCLI